VKKGGGRQTKLYQRNDPGAQKKDRLVKFQKKKKKASCYGVGPEKKGLLIKDRMVGRWRMNQVAPMRCTTNILLAKNLRAKNVRSKAGVKLPSKKKGGK